MPTLFRIIVEYSWLYLIGIGFLNYIYTRAYANKVVEKNPELEPEASRVLLYLLGYLTIPFAVLGILQTIGGYANPFYIFEDVRSNTLSLIGNLIIVFWWGIGAYWTFFKGGAKKQELYIPARGMRMTERRAKIIFAIAGLFVLKPFSSLFFPI